MTRVATLLLVGLLITGSLAACGRKGPLEPPPPEEARIEVPGPRAA